MRRAVVGVVLSWCAVASADPLDVSLANEVAAGHKPTLTLTAKEVIATITLDIERASDHKQFHYRAGPLRSGEKTELAVGDGKSGHDKWKGQLVSKGAWGEFTNEVTFDATVGASGGPKVTYDRAHLDLERGVLQFQVGKPAQKAELTVLADDGTMIATVEKSLVGSAAGRWLSIAWTPTEKPVLRLELVVTGAGGNTRERLVPWSVAIRHEEVVFASGQSIVAPSEAAKLDASYQKIIDAVDKVRKLEPSLDVRVYIAGHTDTVGGSDDNRKLSQARARAIAEYFRDHGLPLPLYYAGFGEDQPRVKTADNVDEARNRRADYVVGVEEPAQGRGRYVVLK